ncbi:unnamed protein product [Spodoptera littoralis]|uniref:Uncharacterized protein n=1 Tax=Spodoptera littoralis TaxID=7109 RepID=A0A9P0MZ55_SPOLI|nr:unnamed protein product [Spodoptera littoralis]CAH1635703.1 unnamed protein product [Spodoptera littoralis]
MFRHFLAFLLINSCYQSLGNPIDPVVSTKQLLSSSLATLASKCENTILSNQIASKIKDCNIIVPPYKKKQFQCLIFLDISTQLCSAKVVVNEESLAKVNEKQDVNAVCALAKEWVFTNVSEFVNYKESAEKYFKLPATCGEVCGEEDTMNDANYYCKYYKWGLEQLKVQVESTVANNANNNAVAPPAVSEQDVSAKADVPAPASNPINQEVETKTWNGQIKQTDPAVSKSTQKIEVASSDIEVVKPETVASNDPSKQSLNSEIADSVPKNEESDPNVDRMEDPVIAPPENIIPSNNSSTKTVVVSEEKPVLANDPSLPDTSKNLPVSDKKPDAVLENPKAKPVPDTDEYADSDGNDNVGDEEAEDPGLDIKSEQDTGNQQTFIRNKILVPAHEAENSQKDFFPNSMPDGFSEEDNDHFFPFFMTSVVLMVLLYVLYHNKSKVSKVFFGLILEGRQSSRRRNSRGHAYRRLDTLEQAMSANTAAPPSKIIY